MPKVCARIVQAVSVYVIDVDFSQASTLAGKNEYSLPIVQFVFSISLHRSLPIFFYEMKRTMSCRSSREAGDQISL